LNKKSGRSPEIHNYILSRIEDYPDSITNIAAAKFGISKQAVRKHLKKIADDGLIVATGATRDREYHLNILSEFNKIIPIESGISEDQLWREMIRPIIHEAPANIIAICQYGFTEMVNNVLEHSEGSDLAIQFRETAVNIEMVILDNGIGIFNKIATKLGMEDKIQVILELAKGKLTTDPQSHTGEGVFFTSRAFDYFSITSGNLYFSHTETGNDWLLEEKDNIVEGTGVVLKISLHSNRILHEVFDRFTDDEDYGFSKTHIPVTLARYGDENLISRSQAKRILTRFERFKEIVLDFNNVEMIGQAFADEIFRVFTSAHPAIHINYVSANEQVEKMIRRAISSTRDSQIGTD
jgi:anti-sigma regulatory factor (Ser/Thr protein kinase)/biotin operon repressor